jgi:DNA mismatch repair protein MutL
MGNISVLSEQIVNRIAAGEVIERPSSVVKELVENSLDAQATMISVSVRHGGKGLIKVVDNGTGMDPEDAALCLKSHATSKIRDSEDIFKISSFGFRGEALASIASVARVTLSTMNSSQQVGTEIEAVGGKIQSVKDKGIPVGTSLEISDLFFNTPARRKFLKSERAEYASIAEAITTMSLAHPRVAFKLHRDGKLIFEYPSCAHLKERLLATHYHEWLKHLLPLDIESEGIHIGGYIGKAELSRVNRTGQLFFINKRPVKSLPLSYSLKMAYQGLLPQKHFPVAIVFLEIDPATVDVNVHPTKREVRMQNERSLQQHLVQRVKEVLDNVDHSPSVSFTYSLEKKRTYSGSSGSAPFNFKELQEKVKERVSYPVAAQGNITSQQAVREQTAPPWPDTGEKLKVISPLAQIRGSYILVETEEGLIIIDQHAAHERIIFERILDSLEKKDAVSQTLLLPVTLQLSFKEAQLLEGYLDILATAGFSISYLGNNTFCVDAAPACLGNVEVQGVVQDFIHGVMEGKGKDPLGDRKEKVAKLLACKTQAVKANEKLAPEEMKHLVDSLERTRQPFTCPHGRPTFIKFTMHDLEKHFKRK